MAKAKETYVPPEILDILNYGKSELNFATKESFNDYIKQEFPDVPRSSRTRWVRSFMAGAANTETPAWHTRYTPSSGMIPDIYSDLRNGNWEQKRLTIGDEIRYANLSCLHRPFGDGALLTLVSNILYDFRPNLFPCGSDWMDAESFSSHSAQPHTTPLNQSRAKNRYYEFKDLTLDTLNIFKPALPKDCLLVNLWGNHENRILRHLLSLSGATGDDDISELIIDNIFSAFRDAGILWLEADAHRYLPITPRFWICHGHLARGGEGATARAYMNKLKSTVSVAAGHTHRQEVTWSTTPHGDRFYAIAGTLGPLNPAYAKHDFMGHNWGFQLITYPFDDSVDGVVEDIRIYRRGGYYITNWRGREYSEKAAFERTSLFSYV